MPIAGMPRDWATSRTVDSNSGSSFAKYAEFDRLAANPRNVPLPNSTSDAEPFSEFTRLADT